MLFLRYIISDIDFTNIYHTLALELIKLEGLSLKTSLLASAGMPAVEGNGQFTKNS